MQLARITREIGREFDDDRSGAWAIEMLLFAEQPRSEGDQPGSIRFESCAFISERPHDEHDVEEEPAHWAAVRLAFDERSILGSAAPLAAATATAPNAPARRGF